jgi:hypothetical protein
MIVSSGLLVGQDGLGQQRRGSGASYGMDLEPVMLAVVFMASDAVLLTFHLAATASMFGLIWFVQIVHYPLFGSVGHDSFVAYETAHRRRTSYVVGPLMAAEALTAVLLVANPPTGVGVALPVAGVVLLGVIHMSTVLLQVPRHAELNNGYDDAALRRLVRSNWVRTIGWSGRCAIAVALALVAS